MKAGETPASIASPAALLGQSHQVRVPPLFLLKAGGALPPIFVAHGLGGNVLGLVALATQMQVGHPIYGMQARGLDGFDEPLQRIEDMAEYYFEAITRVQPHGPYFLVGFSLGGLVTLEVARLLSKNGEKIALLAMLDSYPDRRYLSIAQRGRLVMRLGMHRAANLLKASGLRDPLTKEAHDRDHNANAAVMDEAAALAMKRVTESQYRALRNYRPRFYAGKIKFVRAENCFFLPDDPVGVWAHLAADFEAETVPGEHVGLLTTQVENLASTLSRYVEAAIAGK